ncbi:hypothetical protein Tco_1411938 [Tanacetum coccineum]
MPKKDMEAISNVVHDTLKKVVPLMVNKTTNDGIKKNLIKVVAEGFRMEREKVKNNIAAMVAEPVRKEQDRTWVELLLQVTNDAANNHKNADLPIWLALKYKYEKTAPYVKPCRVVDVRTHDHEDHHDDARPEGESSAKRQKTSKHGMYTNGTNDDEIPDEEVQCDSGEEHQYHLDQMQSYMESQIVWESRKEDLTMQIPKKPTPIF